MNEYPIARLYADSRISRIYGGSNEIQREVVGRSL
jgi:acyl-CoA dehydrogenase